MEPGIRLHDKLYLNEDRKDTPKENFKFLLDKLPYSLNHKRVMDIGCATGDFLHYLSKLFPDASLFGLDVYKELIDVAKKEVPSVEKYYELDISSEISDIGKFDVVTCLGVLSIFDDIEKAVSNLTSLTKPGGKLFIHGMFNPYDVDVFIKYRSSENYGIRQYESGWNIISQKVITKLLTDNGAKNIQFHDFSISIDIEKNPSDPLRSWTENLENGRKQIINGLNLKQPQFILEADL